LILPTIVLGTIPLAVIARQTRSAMLEVLSEDYVRTARAKGLSSYRVVGVHALRNAMIPVVTTIGLQVGVMLGGAVLTEIDLLLAWHRQMDRRFGVAPRLSGHSGGALLIIASIVMLVNLIVDLLYGLINPRIR
jgi:dipeptide transport system permease protein